MLTSEQIRQLRALLQEQESVSRATMHKAVLERAGRGDSGHKPKLGDDSGQPVADPAQAVNAGMLTHAAAALLAIEAAKQRLKDNTYGLCLICHGPITFSRLLALPTAQRCLPCQELHERAGADHSGTIH